MQHRIGVISDTHIPCFRGLPEAVFQHFADVELIIHAGDLSILSVISELETITPVIAVQGNVEREEVVRTLPIKREVVVGPTFRSLQREKIELTKGSAKQTENLLMKRLQSQDLGLPS